MIELVMIMIEMMIILGLLVAGVLWIALPLMREQAGNAAGGVSSQADQAELARRETEEALADLEYDFRSGKLAEADYRQLKEKLLLTRAEELTDAPRK